MRQALSGLAGFSCGVPCWPCRRASPCLLDASQQPPPPPPTLHPLQGSSEAKTAAKLNAVFAEASRFAPCLLLLRHLDVLVSTRGAADPNTAVGTLKLAAALQANIDR